MSYQKYVPAFDKFPCVSILYFLPCVPKQNSLQPQNLILVCQLPVKTEVPASRLAAMTWAMSAAARMRIAEAAVNNVSIYLEKGNLLVVYCDFHLKPNTHITHTHIQTHAYAGVVIEIAPEITQPPVDTSAVLYSEVVLTCLATGSPQPAVKWYRNGARLFEDADVDSPTLIVPEMGIADRGFYHCVASNSVGSVVSGTVVLNIDGMGQIALYRIHPFIIYMFHTFWEFALSADSAALSRNSQKALHFLGILRKHTNLQIGELSGNF